MSAPTSPLCTIARSGRTKDDRVSGRRAATRAIAAHCAVPSEDVRLVGRAGAAPLALVRDDDANWSALPVSISVSHHDGCGLAAVADSPARVGVDLARLGEIEPEHRRYFLAPSEWAIADRVGTTAVWALKEAAWKALSLSPDTPFTALELVVDDECNLRGLRVHGRVIFASGRTWRFSRGLIAAVVRVRSELE